MKSGTEKLKKEILVLEKNKQKLLDKQIQLILKTDPEIIEVDEKIKIYKKLLKSKEEMEQKLLQLDQEIEESFTK